tara:strand:- start:49 stop:522 length:474 start_codon:yes stop_codon:yes gene_type:complete
MAKDDLTKGQKDQIEHYEDATYRQDFTPNPADDSMVGHNQIIWLQNECKRLVKERDDEHKLRQEAETETILVKGIGMNSPEMKAANVKIEEMRKELDRVKLENNNLFTRVADALEVNEYHQRLNGKLQVRVAELEEDNKRISRQIEDQLDRARKAGL